MKEATTFYIKNMVCSRCIRVVHEEMEKIGFRIEEIELGRVLVSKAPTSKQAEQLKKVLHQNGFEFLEDKNARLVERIKTALIKIVYSEEFDWQNFSLTTYLSKLLNKEYSSLSHLFSSVEGITIEHYLINQKIERVKEWLVYNDFTLSEMSYRHGYSSVNHLSKQFKQITGSTPSEFKNMRKPVRISLDRIGKYPK